MTDLKVSLIVLSNCLHHLILTTKTLLALKGVKRQENCTPERINETNIVITHSFNLNNHSFIWENLEYSEIPIYSITLYPNYDLKNEDIYIRSKILIWYRESCGYHEPGTRWKNYSKDSMRYLMIRCNWNIRQIRNTNYRFTYDSGP